MGRIQTALHRWFGMVAGTTGGILVPEELYRAVVTSLGSGGVVGLALLCLAAIQSHVAVIFPNPVVGFCVAQALTLVIDLLRRQNHEDPMIPPPAPHGAGV